MEHFFDQHGNKVSLSFNRNAFAEEPQHVFVLCMYKGDWLLTNHAKRGYEFPGGKREANEMIEDAAIREVFEETGGCINTLEYIGEYKVHHEQKSFVKAIFFAHIDKIVKRPHYFETKGPVLVNGDLLKDVTKHHYSFIMKDQVLHCSLAEIKQRGLLV